jgi:hypothetical protein
MSSEAGGLWGAKSLQPRAGEGGDKFRKDHACCTPAAHCLSPFRDSVCLSLCVYPICVVSSKT